MSYGPPTLRNYQHDAVASVLKEFESHDSTMVVMATGLGKTVTFCEVIRRMQPRRAIVVAHRQELITQACGALERAGMATEIEMADHKADASMFQGSSVIVAMVQSLISGKKDSKRMEKFRPQDFGLLVIDECFPSGTLVDGRPIEGLKVGDCATTALPGETLPHWNVGLQRISAIFKRKPYRMVSVHFSDGSRIACTPEHPFWSDSRKDWVLAVLLDSDDVVLRLTTHELSMQELRNINGAYDQVSQGSDSGRSGTVLQSRMCEGVVQETILRDNGGDKSEVCVTADEGEKPNESSRDQRKGVSDSQNNGPQTYSERGKRTATNGPAENAWRSVGVDFGICDSNKNEEGLRVSNMLQGGPCQPDINDRRGSGRKFQSRAYTKEPGPKEGSFFEKLRVDRIEVHEQTSDGTFGGVCPDGYVYNIEVEHAHHYFANGILVHNCHHSVASSYKEVIDHFRQNTALKVLGVTATPDRFDAKALGQICESVAFKYDIAEAIEDGWLVPIEQQFVRIKSLDISHVRTTAGDLNGADLAKVWEDEKNLQGMVGASISVIGNRKAIAFTSSVRHAEMCCDIFNRHRAGMAAWISGDTPEDDRRKILTQFKASEVQVLANVGIATEGFDCPDAEVVIMGRATKSRSLYTQMCIDSSTEILTDSGWKRRETVTESDKVAAFDIRSQEVRFVPILSRVDRAMEKWEKMYGITNPMLDIRVTNLHSMIVRTKLGRRRIRTEWLKRDASSLSGWFEIPCAGFSDFTGVELSENDLKFIGIVLTDGCVNKKTNAIQITQGEHQPWLPEIEDCISKCGFKYSKHTAWRKTQFNQTSKRVLFSISFGRPRSKDKHLTGWSRLDGYLDKNISPLLMRMSTPQFKSFLEGLHLGDGIKHLNRDYTRRSYHIVSARKSFVDRLQWLCAFHGFSSNSSEHLFNTNPIWVVHIKPRHTRSLVSSASDMRPTWGVLKHSDGERVWCVENILGTIVTRRNGKVAIVGNCGRVTRPIAGVIDGLNSAFERCEAIAESRKPSALVLDFVGNSGKHKLVTTADILGGKYDEETMAEAVKEAEDSGQPVRMDKALGDAKQKIIERIEQAKLEEARRKAKLVARVEFVSRHISPFDAFQITPKQDSKWDKGRPLSEKQRAVLLKLGVNPDETNYAACKQVLYEYFRRKEEGLCTLAQAKVLLRAGYNPKKLKFEEASLLIDDLKKNNWQRTDQLIAV